MQYMLLYSAHFDIHINVFQHSNMSTFRIFHLVWPNLSFNILHSAVVFLFFGLACFIYISSKCNRGKE